LGGAREAGSLIEKKRRSGNNIKQALVGRAREKERAEREGIDREEGLRIPKRGELLGAGAHTAPWGNARVAKKVIQFAARFRPQEPGV